MTTRDPSETSQAVPGRYGPPLLGTLGDTFDFLLWSGWEKFFTKRRDKYGSTVFKASPFMDMTVVLDYQAFEPFFDWDGRLEKDYGFGWAVPPLELVGNVPPSIFEPAEIHDPLKRFYMALLKRRAPSLVSTVLDVSSQFFERWATQGGGFSLRDEIEDLCATMVFRWYLRDHPDPADVRFLYNTIFLHRFAAVEKRIPRSTYNRSKPVYARLLRFVKESPAFEELIDLAAAEGVADRDVVAKQCVFLIGMNNFLGVQGFSKALIGELSIRPEVRERIRAEIEEEVGALSAEAWSLDALARLTYLDNVVKETFRLHPPVFFIYGRATRDFDLDARTGRYAIPKGELLMGVIPLAQEDPDLYADPLTFNPDRFVAPEAGKFLIWAHGRHCDEITAHSRICPGRDVAVTIAKLVAANLVAGYDWSFVAPNLTWSRRRFNLNVAAPVGDLQVSAFSKRARA